MGNKIYDSYITANELKVFLDVLGENVTKDEIDEMIHICDINGNFKILRKRTGLYGTIPKINTRK